MVKKLTLGLLLLGGSSAALASAQPTDVPAPVLVTPAYAAGTTPDLPLDASTFTPYRGLTPIATSPETGWKVVNGTPETGTEADYLTCFADGGPGTECKFRTVGFDNFVTQADSIRAFGQPGNSHLHQEWGSECWNAYATYATLRACPQSTMAGGRLNGTAYWRPAFEVPNALGDGKTRVVRASTNITYYRNDGEQPHRTARMPYGLRFVSGWNMDDPAQTRLQGFLDAANAQPATAGRYTITNPSGTFATQVLYACNSGPATGVSHHVLKNADGSDPWGGNCTGSVATPGEIDVQINMASCGDNTNLWSDGGYNHVLPVVWDNYRSKWVCPTNYVQFLTVSHNLVYKHTGPSDYMNWRLSSDTPAQTNAGRTVLNGESMHVDWQDGANPATRNSWEDNCGATEGHVGHLCDASRYSPTEVLITSNAPPDGSRTSQIICKPVGCVYITNSAANMYLKPTSTTGPHHMDMQQ